MTRALLLLALLLAACAPPSQPPAPPAPVLWGCVAIGTRESPDSLYVAMYHPPCSGPRNMADTVFVWRVPSRHRECVLFAVADVQHKTMETTWQHCPLRKQGDEP